MTTERPDAGDHTRLVISPRVRVETRKVYVVDWTWLADDHRDYGSGDWVEQRHHKTYFSRKAAYRHAAWGFIINRRSMRGCTSDKCKFGECGDSAHRGFIDERCHYCNPDKANRICDRLARWLRWRDSMIATGGAR